MAIDYVFLALVVLCGVRGFSRGFIEEFFSKAAFILALLCGLLCYKMALPLLTGLANIVFLQNVLAFVIVFSVVYIAVRLVQKLVGVAFKNDIMRGLDKSLGFFLGLAEALLCIMLVLFLLHSQRAIDVSTVLAGSFFDSWLSPVVISLPDAVSASGVVNNV